MKTSFSKALWLLSTFCVALGAGVAALAASTPTPSGMVLIPAGSFTMGNCTDPAEGVLNELPLHTVYVSAFYMDSNLVSYTLWTNVYQWATNHGYSFDHAGKGKAANHPVQTIDWYDCVKWCNARSQEAGRTPVYFTDAGLTQVYTNGEVTVYANWWAKGYRLPTEAEWEKAARGGASGHRFPWSDADTIDWSRANYYVDRKAGASTNYYPYDVNPSSGHNPAWTSGGSPYTSPVGSFAANGYGLYGMAGNVWEWCWDWYGSYSSGSQTDPRGPATVLFRSRVFRGGGWYSLAYACRAAYRNYGYPADSNGYLGFRSVLPSGQ